MWIFFGLMIAINGFIIYQSCLPEGASSTWSEAAVKTVEGVTQGNVNTNTVLHNVVTNTDVTLNEALRKILGHFALFGASGLFTYLFFFFLQLFKGFKKYYLHIIISLGVGIIISSLAELIQMFVPGRSADIIDVLLNLGGFVIFSGLAIVTIILIYHFKKKHINNFEAQ